MYYVCLECLRPSVSELLLLLLLVLWFFHWLLLPVAISVRWVDSNCVKTFQTPLFFPLHSLSLTSQAAVLPKQPDVTEWVAVACVYGWEHHKLPRRCSVCWLISSSARWIYVYVSTISVCRDHSSLDRGLQRSSFEACSLQCIFVAYLWTLEGAWWR